MAKQLIHHTLIACLAFGIAMGGPSSSTAQEIIVQPDTLPQRSNAYISDALRLAGILGRAHAIRVACNGRSDQFWRLYMQEMMDLEAPSQGGLRDSMARTFNDSFAREADQRQWCDDASIAAEATHAARGRVVAARMAQHYFKRN